ncbi:hypothetical protein Cantr_06799 [Candida viswanathii]|uniref:Uncharacterized protein n=1 Tax=Candida viswanathii TaxID=5486 RepID=A0A367XUF9_9ASCO|nr:hypothetical protein Cantr_06799 [Candida viswanathii]
MDEDEDFTYGQTPALPISEEIGSEVAAYLMSVRQEALAGPPVLFVASREETASEEPIPIQQPQELSAWSEHLLEEFLSVKQQLNGGRHVPKDSYIPGTTADWRKFLLQEPPEISYFFTSLDRQAVFKLIVHITKWLSISSRPTLSQWIWKIFLRIDNVLDANECSTIRDLGKKANKLKQKQLESDKEVDSISRYTVDLVLIIVVNTMASWTYSRSCRSQCNTTHAHIFFFLACLY